MSSDEHTGSCHCHAVEFGVRADLRDSTILECNCSICRRRGYLHLIVPPDRFELRRGRGALHEYRFHTRTALHLFCEICGVTPFYRPRSHPESIDVNVRCLEDVDLDAIEPDLFDGANWDDHVDAIRD